MNTELEPTEEKIPVEEVISEYDELTLDIPDIDLVTLLGNKIKESATYIDEKLKKRRELNTDFFLGNQINESQLLDHQKPVYKDNIIWQDLEKQIAIAVGRLPDITIVPGSDSTDSIESAKEVERALDIAITSKSGTKKMIKKGLRHKALKFIGCEKVRWDKNKGENGDIVFEIVNPKNLIIDHKAGYPDDGFTSDNMEYIGEWIEEPASVVYAKFPAKKAALQELLGNKKPAKIRYMELYFTWFDSSGKRIEGVLWKYDTIILGKSKNPTWDWIGTQKFDNKFDNGQPVIKNVYRNFFDRPRKPYIFYTYLNLGESPYEDTTEVEQAISLQQIVNKRGMQITEISDNAIPKKAFNNSITKEAVEQMDNDPNKAIWLDTDIDIRTAVTTLQGTPPSPILYNDAQVARQQLDSKFSTHSTTRGETANESGISKQISREGDLTTSDDIVSQTVETVIYEKASWLIQMMKVMYTKEHFMRSMGKDGEMIQATIQQDKIEDGIDIIVKANSVDKPTRRAQAIELAKMGRIDPLTMYEDLDESNPKERTRRFVTFEMAKADGFVSYMKEIGLDMPGNSVPDDIKALVEGRNITPPQKVDEQYIRGIMSYVQGPEFASQTPDVQQRIQEYIAQLKSIVDQQANNTNQPPTGEPPAQPNLPLG